MAALGELMMRIAHEIKNPLGIIKGSAQILVDETEAPDVKSEVVGFIIDEINRLDIKVRDLLSHSRPKPLNLQRVDINAILEERIHFWESQRNKGKHITIARQYDQDLPLLLLDKEQIRQVVLNMILNCSESIQDSGTITVTTGLEMNITDRDDSETGVHVLVTFKDTGIGIREDYLARIFDPFFTTKKDGTGLGLSTVHRLIENHKGKISVESEVGIGTLFKIYLPISSNPV